jgi:hypothetical protein
MILLQYVELLVYIAGWDRIDILVIMYLCNLQTRLASIYQHLSIAYSAILIWISKVYIHS